MNCNLLLFGSVSSGKSTFINTLSQKFIAETNVDITPFKNNDIFNDYSFGKNKNIAKYKLDTGSEFEKLDITDTQGIDNISSSDKYVEKIKRFIDNKDDLLTNKIIVYLIDASNKWNDVYMSNIKLINDCIHATDASHTWVDVYVIFNKCDQNTIDIDTKIKNIASINKNIKSIKMSCYNTFLNSIAGKKYDIDTNGYKIADIKNIIKTSGYRYTRGISTGLLKNNVLKCELLKKKANDEDEDEDQEDEQDNDIYNIINKTNDFFTKKKAKYTFSEFSKLLNSDNINYSAISKCLKIINKLNNNIDENMTKLKNLIDLDIETRIEEKKERVNIPYLLQMQEEYNYKFISDLVCKHQNKLDFKTLFDSYVHDVNNNRNSNDICNMLIKDNQIFSKNNFDKIISLNISNDVKYYLSICNMSVLQIDIMIQMNNINYETLDEYFNGFAKLTLTYVVKSANDKNTKIYEYIQDLSKNSEYDNFMTDYKSMKKYVHYDMEHKSTYNDSNDNYNDNDNDSDDNISENNNVSDNIGNDGSNISTHRVPNITKYSDIKVCNKNKIRTRVNKAKASF